MDLPFCNLEFARQTNSISKIKAYSILDMAAGEYAMDVLSR